MTRYIEVHRDRFGVEPICRVLQVAPSTYYAQRTRPPSARAVRDQQLKVEIAGSGTPTSRCMGPPRSGGSSAGKASGWAVTGWPG